MIKTEDIRLVEYALETALGAGADKARATFSRSGEDLVATLNGEIDKVTHCADSSLCMALFVDGRFGTFSTDKLDREALRRFIGESADIVRMLAPDACRDLPDPARCCRDAVSGNELGLLGGRRESVTPRMRNEIALKAGIFPGYAPGPSPFEADEPDACIARGFPEEDYLRRRGLERLRTCPAGHEGLHLHAPARKGIKQILQRGYRDEEHRTTRSGRGGTASPHAQANGEQQEQEEGTKGFLHKRKAKYKTTGTKSPKAKRTFVPFV